ncbi:hypothetical protein EDB83DRAFT_2321630 [Lactarius deliciosus]|nr:hypothetical protein EDB83DRAFT_2321630 [Lactarius deliciosus]
MSHIRMTWLPSPPAKVIMGNGIKGILEPISVLAVLLNVLHRLPCNALAPSIDYFFGLWLADQVWNAAWARLNCLFNCLSIRCQAFTQTHLTSCSTTGVLVMEWTRPLPPPLLLPCKRRLPWYKSDPVVEPPPKCVRFDLDILLDEDIVMNDPTPVDPSTGIPQLEQKTPDNQGEPEAEAPDSQNDRWEVVASVLVPEQLTEVHHEPKQETENVDTENDAADGQGAEGQVETAGAQENELEVLTPTALEESQRPDAVEVVPESNAIGPPELKQTTDSECIPHSHERKDAAPLELNMEVARAAGGGATILTSEPQKSQQSSECRSAMTSKHISAPETNFGTIDNRVAVMKEEYVKTSNELVHNWLKVVNTRRQSLERSRIALYELCRTKLYNSSPGIVVPARLEFQVHNNLCDEDDKTKAETLHLTLVEMVEGLCADFPGRCAETALNQLIMENAIISAKVSSSESFGHLSQSTVDTILSQASDVIRDIIQYERKLMDKIINCMRQTGQNAHALVEQQTKESNARFIEKLNSSQRERRGSHSNNYFSQSHGERALQETKQAASKQRKVQDQQTEAAANQTTTPEHEGLTMQQQQREAAEVWVELEQQQKRQEEALRLWKRCDKPQQLERQQWEEQTATKPFLQKEKERLKQEATNQEHERERLEQEAAANQEHERERLAQHHQEHEVDDLDCQNQEAANEERKVWSMSTHYVLLWCSDNKLNSHLPSSDAKHNRLPRAFKKNNFVLKIVIEISPWRGTLYFSIPQKHHQISTKDHQVSLSPPDLLIMWTWIPTLGRWVSPSPPNLERIWTQTSMQTRPVCRMKPPSPPDPSGGVTDSSYRNVSSAGLCLDHLSELSAAIERNTKTVEQNTKTVELVLSQVLHLQHRANTSSTCKDQDKDLDEDSPAPIRKRRKFRAPSRKTVHRDPDELGCHSLAVLMLVLKEPHRTSAPPQSAPDEAVLKYNETLDDEDRPSKPVNGPWNDRLFEIFLVNYAHKHSDNNVKDLSTYFVTYLQTLQTACRKMKTTEGKATYEVNLRHSRIEKRKKTRFQSQISALHYYDLGRFIRPLTKMSHVVLSDDKSDHENGTNLGQGHYAIVGEVWHSDELIKWLRMMDLLACGEKWDGRNVARQGNSRRLRLHSSRLKDGVAILGLPENCYNPDWLNSLKRYERELLDVQPPLDMQFSDEERRHTATYIPLANVDK